MRRAVILFQALLVIVLPLLSACSSSKTKTKIQTVWHDKDLSKNYHSNILVIGISSNLKVREAFENAFVQHFREMKIQATPGLELLPADVEIKEETVKPVVEQTDIDGILVSRLVSDQMQKKYVGGQADPLAYGYQGNYYYYYTDIYTQVHTSGYLEDVRVVSIESHFYSRKTGKLAWKGLTQTFEPKDAQGVISALSAPIISELKKAGLIK